MTRASKILLQHPVVSSLEFTTPNGETLRTTGPMTSVFARYAKLTALIYNRRHLLNSHHRFAWPDSLPLPKVPAPKPEITERLSRLMPPRPFHLSPGNVREIELLTGLTVERLMIELLPIAAGLSRSLDSSPQSGAVAINNYGSIYLGSSLEFQGLHPNQNVSPEQFLAVRAHGRGVRWLRALATTTPPTARSLKFINEMPYAETIRILVPGQAIENFATVSQRVLGPQDRKYSGGNLFAHINHGLEIHSGLLTDLAQAARNAANRSYAPHTEEPAGVAILFKRYFANQYFRTIITGSFLESGEMSSSVSPLQAALVNLVAQGYSYGDIAAVVLAEGKRRTFSHLTPTKALLASIAPEAKFAHIDLIDGDFRYPGEE